MTNRKLIFLSLLTSFGIILGLFESQIPLTVAIPGARLGLSNIVVLVTIISIGYKEGLIVALLKTVILVLVSGQVTAFFYSFAGALLSCFSMILSHKFLSKYLSLVGISEIGSFFHNLGQILVASLMLKSLTIMTYLPLLVIIGIFTGYFVGISAIFMEKHLNKIKFKVV